MQPTSLRTTSRKLTEPTAVARKAKKMLALCPPTWVANSEESFLQTFGLDQLQSGSQMMQHHFQILVHSSLVIFAFYHCAGADPSLRSANDQLAMALRRIRTLHTDRGARQKGWMAVFVWANSNFQELSRTAENYFPLLHLHYLWRFNW